MIRDLSLAILAALLALPFIVALSTCEVRTTADGTCVSWGMP